MLKTTEKAVNCRSPCGFVDWNTVTAGNDLCIRPVEAYVASWIEFNMDLGGNVDFLGRSFSGFVDWNKFAPGEIQGFFCISPAVLWGEKQNSKYCKKVIVLWKNAYQRIMSYNLKEYFKNVKEWKFKINKTIRKSIIEELLIFWYIETNECIYICLMQMKQ